MPQTNLLEDVANDLALWIDSVSTDIALAFSATRSPFSARVTEEQKLEFYRSRLFNPDGSPNQQGRDEEMQRLGSDGFAQVFKAVVRRYPELKPPQPQAIEVPQEWPQPPPGPGAIPGGPPGPPPGLPPGSGGTAPPPIVPPRPPMMPPGGGLPPGVRAMASGGVVTQPTLALIGEAGPEAVVPLADYQYQQPNYFAGATAPQPPPRQPVTMWDDVIRPHAGDFADDPRFLRIAAAAAQAESTNNPNAYQLGYDPNDPRTHTTYGGRGLWQFDINKGAKGYGVPEEQLMDPNYQASVIVPEFARNYARLQGASGLTEQQLAAQVYGATEYPEGTVGGRWRSPNERAYQNYLRAYNNLAPPVMR